MFRINVVDVFSEVVRRVYEIVREGSESVHDRGSCETCRASRQERTMLVRERKKIQEMPSARRSGKGVGLRDQLRTYLKLELS